MIRKFALAGLLLAVAPQAVQAQNQNETLRRFAVGTQPIQITYVQHLDVECVPVGPIRFIIIKQPASGTVSPQDIQVFSNFDKDNRRHACNAKRTPALAVNYKAKDGFKGDDRFTFGAVFYDGSLWRYDVTMTVY